MKTKERMKVFWHKLIPVACVAGSLVLYLLLMLAHGGKAGKQDIMELERDIYGGAKREVELVVDGLGYEASPLSIKVRAREYTEEEARIAFEAVMEGLGEWILGENTSLLEIRSDLNLKTYLDTEGIRLRWLSGNPDVINSRGQVTDADIKEQGEEGYLSVRLSAGHYSADYELSIKVFPPLYSREEQQIRAFLQELASLDEQQKYQNRLKLPAEYHGKRVRYYLEQENNYWMLPLAGSFAAVLLVGRSREQEQKRRKAREQQMLLDYSEVVSKFMVFLGAGMTIRLSLERIVTDYKQAVNSGRQKPRHAYEELSYTCYQIQSGVSEGKAYRELGERCRLQPYLKLGSLFEQNRKSGMKDLRIRMKAEMEDAFEQRKNLVKRLGEEASTKLALPLFMMLGVIMVIVLFPALMNMK